MTTNIAPIGSAPKRTGISGSNARLICASAAAVGFTSFGYAQNAAIPPSTSLDQVVVTATRIPQGRFEANANINVVTREDIDRMHMTSVEEALRTLPGIQFLNYNLPGYNLSRVRINGTDQVLVMIDGVNVTMLGSGIPYPLHFVSDMNDIERNEVLRGSAAASDWYGMPGRNFLGGITISL